jgi:uncharacterized membrane protein
MRAHLDGVPVILETPGEPGTWAGRVSALTGYPTVLGPPAVQQRQRPGMDRMIAWRRDDIERIYGETGPYTGVIPLILRYNIEYIYVGALERVTYGSEALAKFDAAVTDGLLEIAYQEGDVTLYRVLPAVG